MTFLTVPRICFRFFFLIVTPLSPSVFIRFAILRCRLSYCSASSPVIPSSIAVLSASICRLASTFSCRARLGWFPLLVAPPLCRPAFTMGSLETSRDGNVVREVLMTVACPTDALHRTVHCHRKTDSIQVNECSDADPNRHRR